MLSYKTNRMSEFLAFLFGLLMILVIFGDAVEIRGIEVAGNLDTIFGQTLWPFMDLLYPLASIAIFLLYGKTKGGIQFNLRSILIFLVFLAAIVIIQFDDFFVVFRHTLTFPDSYWISVRLVYLFTATSTFFAFGVACSHKKTALPNAKVKTDGY